MFAKQSKGFTLIEVLIAVVVLAVGLLGFAALQLTATINAEEAQNRTVAATLADSLASKIRANYNYTSPRPPTPGAYGPVNNAYWPLVGYNRYCRTADAPFVAPSNCAAAACSGALMASYDRQLICAELTNSNLQGGEIGLRCVDNANPSHGPDVDACSPGSHVTIFVSWQIRQRQDRGEQARAANDAAGDCATIMGIDATNNRCLQLEVVL